MTVYHFSIVVSNYVGEKTTAIVLVSAVRKESEPLIWGWLENHNT